MEIKPSFLDRGAARAASALLEKWEEGGLSPGQVRAVRLALRYYLAPWDLLPDLLPGVGLLDDWMLLVTLASLVGADRKKIPEDVNIPALQRRIQGRLERAS
jgi:hypothetical protein